MIYKILTFVLIFDWNSQPYHKVGESFFSETYYSAVIFQKIEQSCSMFMIDF